MKRILTIITMSAATLWSAAAAAPDAIEVPCIDRPATAVTAMSARHIMSASEALEAAPAAPAKAPAAKAPEGEWADKGSVTWHEGILSVFSDIPEGLSWSVPVQESVSAPGYYRMQPYASESCPVAQTIGRTNAAWFYFNATDPAKVYLEDPEGWYFTLSQIVPENGWEDAGARYGTFRDNVMDFPAQSFAIYLSVQEGQEPQWNAVNLKGQFMIVFPGGEVKDHSIAVDSDICGAGSTAQLRLSALGKDVRGVKVGVFEGYYDAVSPEMITAVVAQGASVDAAAGKAVNLRLRGRGMRTALAVTTDAEGLGREAAVAYMIATEDDAAQWRAVGRGSMTDGIMSCYYGYEIPVETFDVDIEENIERPGYYRIANPYARHTVFGPFHGLLGHDDAGIGARYAHTHVAVGVHGLHELLVHLAGEHHAHKPHGLIGGDALAVDELHGNVELVEHAIDGLAAAVHEHRVDADDLQQHDVGHNFGGKLRVLHGRAAVLDDDSLARDLLDPGHGLVENFAGSAGRTVGTNIACVLHER